MSALIASIGLPEIIAAIAMLALNAYVLTGGADFGGGVWDLFAFGPRRDAQRKLIADSIAPIWEANHVWLIVVVVMLFTAFPAAFATLGIVLHVPITLMLIGIVLRGSAFVFRSYGTRTRSAAHGWGLAFAISSLITPVLLGMIIGALSSGWVGVASTRVESASFVAVYMSTWLSPFALAVGVLALALFAFLAATYLALAATDESLRDDFRVRALAAAIAVFAAAETAFLFSKSVAPRVAQGLTAAPWSTALQAATGVCAIVAIGALWRRRYRAARIAAAGQVSFILWGWALAQYPFIIPTTLTIRAAAAPHNTLVLLAIGLVVGALILIPSLRYLFRTFSTQASAPSHERAHDP